MPVSFVQLHPNKRYDKSREDLYRVRGCNISTKIKGKKYERGLIFEDKKNLKKCPQKYMNFEILITRLEKRVQCIFH